MGLDRMRLTAYTVTFDGLLKTAPLRIAEQGLQIAGAPVFGAVLVGELEFFKRLLSVYRQLMFAMTPPAAYDRSVTCSVLGKR